MGKMTKYHGTKARKPSKATVGKGDKPVIACHEGTGTDVIRQICEMHGYELRVVRSREVATYCHFDGLMLLGGADIHPFWYGEDVEYSSGFDRERDGIEYTLLRRAMAKQGAGESCPIMGICRGHQMITVGFGGTLWQDVDFQETGVKRHGYTGHVLTEIDPLFMERLHTIRVNSFHHQATRQVPYGFQVMARSDDGLIEAIWRPGILGVQFHPELMISKDGGWHRIFDWFFEGLLDQAPMNDYTVPALPVEEDDSAWEREFTYHDKDGNEVVGVWSAAENKVVYGKKVPADG